MNEITKDLLEALKLSEEFLCGPTAWTQEQENNLVEKVSCAIAKAEAALAAPQADADGWIPWSGGECPVHGRVPVEIQAKSGRKQTGLAEVWEWRHFGHRGDIIAYRIAKESGK